MLAAAKQETLSRPLGQMPEGVLPLAAFEGVAENSPPGSARKNPAPHPGRAWSNSGTALGIEPVWLVNGVRSRCTGHERDAESGLDYFEARYYSSPYGRFQSADYFMNDTTVRDPQKWNLYTYVRNSPIRFIDPTGEKIYVGDLSDSDRDEVLRRLNATYGCDSCVSMDEGGYLQVNTEELKEEVRKAAAFLTDAINSEMKFFEVNVSNNDPNVAFGNSQAGGSVVWQGRRTSAIKITLDFGDDKAIAGDSEARSTFLDLVLAHEVRHYFPSGADDPSRCCSTGPVVDATNEITNALGRPRRAQYIAGRRPEPFVDVPFKKNTVDGQGRPKEQTVYLYWNKNSVGGKGIN
jgi:RHS repeat-associated protein